MEISKSYPYLSIAKKHGLEYGEVLLTEQAIRNRDIDATYPFDKREDWVGIYVDMKIARDYFRGVQNGSIPFR